VTATYHLRSPRDRELALAAVHRAAWGQQVRISKAKRTLDQNARLHALLGDIAAQVVWPPPPSNAGEFHDIEWWKRRATLGWLIDLEEQREVITDLWGREQFAVLLPHTSELTTEECASLCNWVEWFGTDNGVVFKELPGAELPPVEAYEGER